MKRDDDGDSEMKISLNSDDHTVVHLVVKTAEFGDMSKIINRRTKHEQLIEIIQKLNCIFQK